MDVRNVFLTGQPAVGKTTIIKSVQKSIQENCIDVVTRGFYTEECRKRGNRIGFDIVHWSLDDMEHAASERHSLSRMTDGIGKPRVGKYLVDIDNIRTFAIPSLSKKRGANQSLDKNLIILDEVGKMEMLCPQFIPAVKELLSNMKNQKGTEMLLGTIPTPRYGRVIPAVEHIRARKDVLVLHVTKSNRDELKEILQQGIQDIFKDSDSPDLVKLRSRLEPFVYERPIGASSMHGSGSPIKTERHEQTNSPQNMACGPLISDTVKPKVLIMGETAPPVLPNYGPSYCYCERSMWIVLGRIFGIDYKPIKDVDAASEMESGTFQDLKGKVLSCEICIWDVLANVHEKSEGRKKRKKRKKGIDNIANDVATLLKRYPSIEVIAFIGKRAYTTYKAFQWPSGIELVTLPSSSPANIHLSVEEKADAWRKELSKVASKVSRN